MSEELQTFGRNLRQLRRSKNMTLRDLHQVTGIKFPYISEVERAKRNVSIDIAATLARGVGSNLASLLKAQDNQPQLKVG